VRIVYDATPLLLRSAGVKNYHHALLARLLPRAAPHMLELFPFLTHLGVLRNERSNYPRLPTAARLGALLGANYLGLPLGAWAGRRADLFHVTYHLRRPPRRPRLTCFLHDLTPLLMPELHTPSSVRYFRRFAADTLPRLAGIVVPSGSARRDLVEKLGVSEERVTVIPHGVDPEFFPPGPLEPDSRAYDLPDRYILFLGALEPRKNLATLLDAYDQLPQALRESFPLVVAGASGWKNRRLRQRLAAAQRAGVRWLGYVPPSVLPLVYGGASLFVFPSLYEGFGLPVLEAMAAGVPVVTSNVSSLPEVAGDAALTVDPRSASELARAIERVLTDSALAADLAQRGQRRARDYTWEKAALATKAFFERVAC